jgi:hypothetical protein
MSLIEILNKFKHELDEIVLSLVLNTEAKEPNSHYFTFNNFKDDTVYNSYLNDFVQKAQDLYKSNLIDGNVHNYNEILLDLKKLYNDRINVKVLSYSDIDFDFEYPLIYNCQIDPDLSSELALREASYFYDYQKNACNEMICIVSKVISKLDESELQIKAVKRTRTKRKTLKPPKFRIPKDAFLCDFKTFDGGHLREIFDELFKGFIGNQTKWLNFKNWFTGRVGKNKIVWIADRGDLYFFIKELKDQDKIYNKQPWLITEQCFIDRNGKPFLKDQLNSGKNTFNSDKLVPIIDMFKTCVKIGDSEWNKIIKTPRSNSI